MTNSQRLEKAFAKIEARKQKLRENGIPESSKFGYWARGLVAPLFIKLVAAAYPKTGAVVLGDTTRDDVQKMIKNNPGIFSPAHRGAYDISRLIAHAVPHSVFVTGGEITFYATPLDPLFRIYGTRFFNRKDPWDGAMIIEIVSKDIMNNQSLIWFPEGTPNSHNQNMLKLYPGIIKIALNTGASIYPMGNELHIIRDQKTGKINGDINYFMYEDYSGGQKPYRPGDDESLAKMHRELKGISYKSAATNHDIESYINGGSFEIGSIRFSLEDELALLIKSHPDIGRFYHEAKASTDGAVIEVAKKGRMTAYDEIDKYINKTTAESMVESMTKKVLKGLEMLGR